MFRDYYFPFLPAALLVPFLLMIFGIDTLSRYSAEKAFRYKQSMQKSSPPSSPSGDFPSDGEKTAVTPPVVRDGPGVSRILGRCLLILIVWSVGGSLLLSVLVPILYHFLLMLFRDGGNVLARSALLTFGSAPCGGNARADADYPAPPRDGQACDLSPPASQNRGGKRPQGRSFR